MFMLFRDLDNLLTNRCRSGIWHYYKNQTDSLFQTDQQQITVIDELLSIYWHLFTSHSDGHPGFGPIPSR